jgi:hypothetical protein
VGGTPAAAKVVPLLAEPKNGKTLVPAKRNKPKNNHDGIFTDMFRCIVGGKKTFMEMARLAPLLDPKLVAFVEEYDRFTSAEQLRIKLTDICVHHDIDPLHLMAVVGEAAMKYRDNAMILIAAINLPQIVKRSVEQALTPEGVDDRRMLFMHSNFIPTSKGTQVNVVNQAAAKAEVNLTKESTLESFEQTVRAADEIIHDNV